MRAIRRKAIGRLSVGLLLLVGAYATAAGCVADDPGGPKDAGPSSDGPASDTGSGSDADAGSRCDPNKPFANKRPLDDINSSGTENGGARLSQDEKTAYFHRFGSDASVGGSDVFVATRASAQDPFSVGLLLNGGNTIVDERWPTVTGDGLFMYVAHTPGGDDILVASRSNTSAPFSSFAVLAGVSSAEYESTPYVLTNQSALYFAADQAVGGVGAHDIYRASNLGGGTFQTPQIISGVSTIASESAPVVTSDERTIYFSRAASIHVARRPNTSSAFGSGQPVTELDNPGAGFDFPTWVSDDDCVLVWSSTSLPDGGTAPFRIFVAERPK